MIRRLRSATGGKRVAYYMRRFPVLTETFIQREISALKEAGVDVIAIADSSDDVDTLGRQARAMVDETIYLRPRQELHSKSRFVYFLARHPWRLLQAFRRIVRLDYSRFKSAEEDRAVLRSALCLASTLVEHHVDHIHAPWAYINAFVASVAGRLVGIPFSVQARAFEIHAAGDMHVLPEKFSAAQFIVTNTRYNARHLSTLMGAADRRKIKVIYNGIDLRQFVGPARSASDSGVFRILSVARLVEQKGLTYLLEACHLLKRRGYRIDCTIVGAPFEARYAEYHQRLRKLHHQLDLEDCVRFAGGKPFEAVLEAHGRADLFVLPCVVEEDGNRDIIPNSLIEAMALRIAVVSTPVGGIPEIVEHGVSGLLVPPRKLTALADAMASLIDSPGLRTALGASARLRVEERFDIRKNIAAYRELFHDS